MSLVSENLGSCCCLLVVADCECFFGFIFGNSTVEGLCIVIFNNRKYLFYNRRFKARVIYRRASAEEFTSVPGRFSVNIAILKRHGSNITIPAAETELRCLHRSNSRAFPQRSQKRSVESSSTPETHVRPDEL